MRYARTVMAVLCLTVAAATPPSRGDEDEVKLSDCPAAVRKTLNEEAKGAEIESVTREVEDGKTTYWADVVIGGKTYGIGVSEDGTLNEFSLQVDEDEVGLSDCPAAVQKAFKEEAKGSEIDGVRRETRFGVTVFRAGVAIGGKSYEIKVAEDGTLTEKSLQFDENEVEIEDCPVAVQKTLREHAKGGVLGEITSQSGIVKRVYQTEVGIQGKTYSIEVAEDGLLISKSLADDH